MTRPELSDAERDYEVLRDAVIEQFNPRDGDDGEAFIMTEAIEGAARFIRSLPCTCPPDAGPPTWDGEPCGRCAALGRARDEEVSR